MKFSDFNELTKTPRSSTSPPPKPHPVLVVDDDATVRSSLTTLLCDQFEVIACATAQEGVDRLSEDVCAVVLDIRMPDHDGFWTCAEIRKRVPDMPVIFYSAYQDVRDPYAIINECRPFGYITKGDDIQKLLEVVTLAVRLQSMSVRNRKLIHELKRARTPLP